MKKAGLFLWVGSMGLFLLMMSTAFAQEGPILWYPFEDRGDTVTDASGNGNDGTRVGGKFVQGKYGQGILIGKQDEYVEFSNILPPVATLMMWFKPNWGGGDAGTYRLFDANTGAIYFMIGKGKTVGDRENTFGFYFEDAADADFQDWETPAADVVTAGEWHHIAAIWDFDNSEAKFYVNGEEVGNVQGMGQFPPLNEKPKIGFNVGTGYMAAANGADSVIDEFAIYPRVLEADEIKKAMEELFLPVDPQGKLATVWASLKSSR